MPISAVRGISAAKPRGSADVQIDWHRVKQQLARALASNPRTKRLELSIDFLKVALDELFAYASAIEVVRGRVDIEPVFAGGEPARTVRLAGIHPSSSRVEVEVWLHHEVRTRFSLVLSPVGALARSHSVLSDAVKTIARKHPVEQSKMLHSSDRGRFYRRLEAVQESFTKVSATLAPKDKLLCGLVATINDMQRQRMSPGVSLRVFIELMRHVDERAFPSDERVDALIQELYQEGRVGFGTFRMHGEISTVTLTDSGIAHASSWITLKRPPSK